MRFNGGKTKDVRIFPQNYPLKKDVRLGVTLGAETMLGVVGS